MTVQFPAANASAAPAQITEELWRQFSDRLRRFITGQVSSPEAVDDILQEVFLKIHRRAHTLRDGERLTSWIFQIARNAVIDHYRSAPRRRELPTDAPALDLPADSAHVPDEPTAVVRREMAACVRPLLAQLPHTYREALELVEFDGLTQTEAAARVGISVSGMKSRVQRGRRQLHGTLRDWCRIPLDSRGQPLACVPGSRGCGPRTDSGDTPTCG